MVVPEDLINKGIGVQLETAQMADLLSRMQLQAEAVPGSQVRVLVPPTRSDVLHACDVMEVSLHPHAAPFLMSNFTLSWVWFNQTRNPWQQRLLYHTS